MHNPGHRCPKGHLLSPKQATIDDCHLVGGDLRCSVYTCDDCGGRRVFALLHWKLQCRRCNWDLCEVCAKKTPGAAEVAKQEAARKRAEEERLAREAADRAKAEQQARILAAWKKKAEEEAERWAAEQAARKKADDEAARRAAEEEAARKKAEEDARLAEEARKQAEEEARQAEEARKKAEEQAQILAARKKAEEEARKKAEEDAAEAKKKAEEAKAAKKAASVEHLKRKVEEAAKNAAEELASLARRTVESPQEGLPPTISSPLIFPPRHKQKIKNTAPQVLSPWAGPCCPTPYNPKLHGSKGPCERCLELASEEEKEQFSINGRHLQIMVVSGGCHQGCLFFPRTEGGIPVRLCKKCYFDTHRTVHDAMEVVHRVWNPREALQEMSF